jgi:hypothetical protein
MSLLHESRSRYLQTLSHAVHPSLGQKDENLFGPMVWHHPQSPRKKKFKTTPSAGKVMITVFLDTDGEILVDVLAIGVRQSIWERTSQPSKN